MDRDRRPVFVSYSSRDRRFVARLVARLRAEGVDVWIDLDDIHAGDVLLDTLERALAQAARVVVVLSPDALASEWVNAEIKLASAARAQNPLIVVVPILVRDCTLPESLRDVASVDFRESDSFDASCARLLRGLHTRLEQRRRDYNSSRGYVWRIRELEGGGDDLRKVAELPLTRLLERCLRFDSCSEAMQSAVPWR